MHQLYFLFIVIAEKKGVIMMNFCTQFLDSVCLKNTEEIQQILESRNLRYDSKEGNDLIMEFAKTHRLVCDSRQLVDHIEHVIKVAGIDYLGPGRSSGSCGQVICGRLHAIKKGITFPSRLNTRPPVVIFETSVCCHRSHCTALL